MLPGDFPTLANLFFGAGNPLALLFDSSSSSSDTSESSQYIDVDDDEFYNIRNPLEGFRLPRSCVAYPYDGDLFANMDGTATDATKHWSNRRVTAYNEKWISGFRMDEATLDEFRSLRTLARGAGMGFMPGLERAIDEAGDV